MQRYSRLPMIGTLLVLLLTLSGTLLYVARHTPVAHADSSTITLTPGTTTTPLMNPGKGWVLYGGAGFGAISGTTIPPYVSIVYDRLEWTTLEPTEGNYNWSLIDGEIQQASQLGLKYAFGVMDANSADCGNTYVTPKWVFDDGAQYTASTVTTNTGCQNFTQDEPVWSDPIYNQKLNTFLAALAQRYDGNPNIAFIDDCSYGNYGEQGVGDLSGSTALTPAQDEAQFQTYLTLFRQTQIEVAMDPTYTMNWSVYDWAVQYGIGLRQEGIPDTDGSGVGKAQSHAPGVVEYVYPYSGANGLKATGKWNTQTISTDILAKAHASYAQMGTAGNDINSMYNDNAQWVASMVNQMGYYFQLTSATIPSTIYNSGNNAFSFNWSNGGTTYLYQPGTVAVALLDSNNTVVKEQVFPGSTPQGWTPGQTTTENGDISFSGVNAGNYQLAVGILRNPTDANPTYLLGNTGQTSNKWYVIDNSVTVSNGTGSGGNSNLVQNPGFETGRLSGWNVWVPNGQSPTNALVEQGGHSGTYRLAEYNSSAFQVSVFQGFTNIPNGTYQLSGWIEGSGKSVMQIRDHPGGNVLSQVSITNPSSTWTQISTTATISGGQADIEFDTTGGASDYLRVDDISFSIPVTNLVQNPGFETGDLTGWNVWVPSGQSTTNARVEQGGYSGTYRLAEFQTSNFEVSVFQCFSNIAAGTYQASAWVDGSGSQDMAVYAQAGGTVLASTSTAPADYGTNWHQISLTVTISGGQPCLAFETTTTGYDYLRVDDVVFAHQ